MTVITKSKRPEKSSNQSEFRGCFENLPLLAYHIGLDGRIVDCNKLAVKTLGYKNKKELVDKSLITTVYAPSSRGKARKLFREWRKMGKIRNEELQIITKQRKVLDVILNVEMVRDEKGKPLHSISTQLDISEKKQKLEDLRKCEERLRLLYEHAPVPYQSLNVDGCFIDVNQEWLNTLGYSRQEVIGRWFGDFLAPNYVDHFKKNFPFFKAAGRIDDVEFEMVKKDGTHINASYTGRIGHDERGRFREARCVFRDVTERRKMELTLRESEEKYRSLFENSIDAVLLTVPDGRILAANPAAVQMFGRTEGEICLLGRDGVVDITDPRLPHALEERRRIGRFREELNFKRRDGTVFPAEVTSSVFKDETGCERTSMIVRDITERKQIADALRESEEKYRAIVENSPNLMGIIQDGFLKYVNKAACERTGRTFREMTSPSFNFIEKLVTPQLQNLVRENVAKRLRGEHVSPYEVTLRARDGSKIQVLVYAQKITYQRNPADLVVLVDITEQKQMEEKLRQNEEKYRELAESIGDVFFAMDSDFKCTYWNKASEKLTGISAKDAIGRSLYEIFPNVRDTKIEASYLEALSTHQPQTIVHEYSVRGRDVVFEINVYPTRDGISVFTKDVTERKRMEEELRESEALLNETGDIAKIGGWEHDLVTRKAKWTKPLYHIVEIESGPPPGPDEYLNYYPPHYRAILAEAYQRAIETGEPFDLELQGYTAKKRPIWGRAIGRPIMQDGKCLRMVGVFQDITERKKSAEKIAKLHSLLTSAKAVDEILLRARSEHELFQETCDSLLK